MKRFALPLAALLAMPCSSQEASAVLALHAEARGGAAAIEAIQSIEVHLTIDEGWVLEGHYRATRDGNMRIDVYSEDERVFTEALHDGSAWAINSIRDGEEFLMPR